MTFGQAHVRIGMAVVDTRGVDVGRVTQADPERFEIDGGGVATTVTYDMIRAIVGDQVVLDTGPDLAKG